MQVPVSRPGRSSSALLWVLGLTGVAVGAAVIVTRSAAAKPLPTPEPAPPLPQPAPSQPAEPGFIGPPASAAPPPDPIALPPVSEPLLPTMSRADFAAVWADAYDNGYAYGRTLSPKDAATKIPSQRVFDGMRHALMRYSRAIPEPGQALSAQDREDWKRYDDGYAQGLTMDASAAPEVVKGEASALGSRDAVADRPSRTALLRQVEAQIGPHPDGARLLSIDGRYAWVFT